MPSQKKIDRVHDIINLLKKNKNFILIKYFQTTHQTLENLRKSLKKTGGTLLVIKNSLFEKAIDKLSDDNKLFHQLKEKFFPLKNPSALLVMKEQWSKTLNKFYEFFQKEKTVGFKFGCLDNQCYNQQELVTIAQLPSQEKLIAKIVNCLKNPIHRFLFAIRFNSNKLVYILARGGESDDKN